MIIPLTHVNSVKQSFTSTLLWVPIGGAESILSCLLVSCMATLEALLISVIMNRDDISSSFSRGMAIAGMSEFFTITCNGMTRKSMAVLVWNQLDMIDPRHGVSFQLHRYESSTLYTQQQPVHQLRLIREVLNQSRNNLSAIFNEKFELNVASMQLPSTDRQRIGPILVEAKVLYAAEKCQRSIGDKLTVNSARDEYYVYCLIMIFMTMVSLIITTRCYIMEIMNENVQTAR